MLNIVCVFCPERFLKTSLNRDLVLIEDECDGFLFMVVFKSPGLISYEHTIIQLENLICVASSSRIMSDHEDGLVILITNRSQQF